MRVVKPPQEQQQIRAWMCRLMAGLVGTLNKSAQVRDLRTAAAVGL